MVIKKWIPWLVIPILFLGIVIALILSAQRKSLQRGAPQIQARSVEVMTVQNSEISRHIEISGHLFPYHQVNLYAEVTGVVLEQDNWFKEGTVFKKGDVLIQLDDRVFRNQLMAQKSSLMNQMTLLLPDLSIDFPKRLPVWTAYLDSLNLKKKLPDLPEITNEQERYYIASRNIFNLFYTIRGMEVTLDKYQLKAPFNGVVTESLIDPGDLMRQGQKAGVFTHTGLYELEASVPIHDLNDIKIGQQVKVTTDELKGEFMGSVERINAVLDVQSQTVKAYIRIRDERLRSGMYASATLLSSPIENVFRIPRKLIVNQNQVYTVDRDSVLHTETVDIAGSVNDSILVHGLNDGQWIVGQPLLDAYNGMKIIVTGTASGRKAASQ